LTPDDPTGIPSDQMDRILPIVQPLLKELRIRTRELPPRVDLPLIYDLDSEAGR